MIYIMLTENTNYDKKYSKENYDHKNLAIWKIKKRFQKNYVKLLITNKM